MPQTTRLDGKHFLKILVSLTSMTIRLHSHRARTWIMGALMLTPCLLPALAAYWEAHYGLEGSMSAGRLTVALFDFLYLYTLVPLAALFYACALLAEEIDGHTFPLLLSRPVPRGALVLGKYFAFVCIAASLLNVSLLATFYTSAIFLKLPLTEAHHGLLIRYIVLCTGGLAAYGALCLMVSTVTRRPALVSALFIFGWEKMVIALPGYADFLTLQKYLGCLLPGVPFPRIEIAKVELPPELMRQVYPVSGAGAVLTLLVATAGLLAIACVMVRFREFAKSEAR